MDSDNEEDDDYEEGGSSRGRRGPKSKKGSKPARGDEDQTGDGEEKEDDGGEGGDDGEPDSGDGDDGDDDKPRKKRGTRAAGKGRAKRSKSSKSSGSGGAAPLRGRRAQEAAAIAERATAAKRKAALREADLPKIVPPFEVPEPRPPAALGFHLSKHGSAIVPDSEDKVIATTAALVPAASSWNTTNFGQHLAFGSGSLLLDPEEKRRAFTVVFKLTACSVSATTSAPVPGGNPDGSGEEDEDCEDGDDDDGGEANMEVSVTVTSQVTGTGQGAGGSSSAPLPWSTLTVGFTTVQPERETAPIESMSAEQLLSAWLISGTASTAQYVANMQCTLIVCAELDALKIGDSVTTEASCRCLLRFVYLFLVCP